MIRGELGGFMHVGKENNRLDLQEILKKYEEIDKSRDKYTDEDRDTYKPVLSYANDAEKSYERDRLSQELDDFKREQEL